MLFHEWFTYTILASLCFSGGILCLRFALARQTHLRPSAANAVFSVTLGALGVAYLAYLASRHMLSPDSRMMPNGRSLALLMSMGVLFFAGNALMIKGVHAAANPGLVRAVMSIEIVLVTLFSGLLLREHIRALQWLGIATVMGGIFLIVL